MTTTRGSAQHAGPRPNTSRTAPDALAPWVAAAFGTGGKGDKAPLHLIGAPFQIKVWEALLAIPSGHVTTYSEIAGAIGNAPGRAGRGHRRGAQPSELADPLPPRFAEIRRAWRVSLGTTGQTRDARLRSCPCRRRGLSGPPDARCPTRINQPLRKTYRCETDAARRTHAKSSGRPPKRHRVLIGETQPIG